MDTLYAAWILHLTVLGYLLRAATAAAVEGCNQTVGSGGLTGAAEGRVTLRLPRVSAKARGKPLYCWYRFEALPQQYLMVDVKGIRAGEYDVDSKGCSKGYLRISDKDVCSTDPEWLPPTTLCGQYAAGSLRVRRITRSPYALVEFNLDSANSSTGYEFDVVFRDTVDEMKDKLPYGDLQRTDGRIPHTKCDWLVPVETCIGHCRVTSPGYPGIYPPSTRCTYLLTSFQDGRVELKFGGRGFTGKFDIKDSPDCADDYMEVYDGASAAVSPRLGRYCGHQGAHLISSGPSLLVLLRTGPDEPPWDYSGFDMQVVDRWKNTHDGGILASETLCDWSFSSRGSKEGDAHTPDHMLPANTTCTYSFNGDYNERLQLEIALTTLRPNCTEYIEVINQNEEVVATVCAASLKHARNERRNKFNYKMTSSGKVRYHTEHAKESSPEPVWLEYMFIADPSIKAPARTPGTLQSFSGEDNDAHTAVGSADGMSSTSVVLVSGVIFVLSALLLS